MRDYGKVSPQFWIGQTGKKLRAEGMEAQIVAMYLMTSPHANMLGLYYCPAMFIAHETGLDLEGATKGLQSAIKAGFYDYDEETEMVWVYEMAHYQIAETLTGKDLRIKGVQNEYDSLPENPYLERFFDKYSASFCMMTKRYRHGQKEQTEEAPSKPLASQEQEQEQEHSKPPSLRDAPLSCSTKQKSITFQTWLLETKAKGEKAVSDYQPVWDYAKLTGIPEDWIEIAWLRFKERYTGEEKAKKKRYIDWRGVFLRAVKENWLGLWFFSEKTKEFCLTTVGVCADIDTREAA